MKPNYCFNKEIFFLILTLLLNPPAMEAKESWETIAFQNQFQKSEKSSPPNGYLYDNGLEDYRKKEHSQINFALHIDRERKSEFWNWEFQGTLALKGSQFQGFVGPQATLGFALGEFLVLAGRRPHGFRQNLLPGYLDAGDGIHLVLRKGAWQFHIIPYDIYTGVRLFSKQSYFNFEPVDNTGYRRHSFGVKADWNRFQFNSGSQILYLPLQLNEREVDKTEKPDLTRLILGNMGLEARYSHLKMGLEFLTSQGRIRNREDNSPVRGQAIQWGISFQSKWIHFKTHGFLSNTNKKNQDGTLSSLGFIGTGTNPFQTPFFSQILQIFPAYWATGRGLQDEKTFLDGRIHGAMLETLIGIDTKPFLWSFFVAHFIPRNLQNGEISIQKRDYERFHLVEFGLSIGMDYEEVNFQILFSQWKTNFPDSEGAQIISLKALGYFG